MKLFISQPMNGLSDEQILKAREKAIDKVHSLFPDRDVKVLPSFFEDYNPTQGNIGLKFLGKSLEMLGDADVAFFCEGWEKARGCRMEHKACEEYGVEIIYG